MVTTAANTPCPRPWRWRIGPCAPATRLRRDVCWGPCCHRPAAAFRTAIRLNPGYAGGSFEADATLERMGALDQAESMLRAWVAAPLSRDIIRREPENPKWHKFHNELQYRLRHADDLTSYDTAPKTVDVLLSKVFFLSDEKRAAEALDASPASPRWNPTGAAGAGLANSLTMLGWHGERHCPVPPRKVVDD